MIKPNSKQQCSMVFGVLVLITLGAALLTEVSILPIFTNHGFLECILISLAAVKIVLIAEYFMELHDAPRWLRGTMLTWVMATTAVLVSIVLFGGQTAMTSLA
ncbi:hypothetical protein A9Q99_01415 [Gammaproteobacteria bacterium 45_16_T64]|nr:hypothetical protein A9Q99_01415 [Gammaproteobacteria bacterium 45_16_T64]